VGRGAPPDATNETAWLPFAGDLAACVIQDMPDTMSQMARANLTFADLSIEQAMSRAMANLARLPSPIFEPLDRGVVGCNNLEDHQSALLLPEPGKGYALPPVEGRPVALVPSRNLFYLTVSANAGAGGTAGYFSDRAPDGALLFAHDPAMDRRSLV
jgi:hypothetical protein